MQVELERRSRIPGRFSPKGPLGSRLVCADCGGFFGAKTWHSSDSYKTVIWRCNDKYRPGVERKSGDGKCCTGHVTEEKVMATFGKIVADLIARKPQVIETCETILHELLNGGVLDEKRKRIEQEGNAKEIEALVEQHARGTVEGFTEKYQELEKRYHRVEDKFNAVATERQDKVYRTKQAEVLYWKWNPPGNTHSSTTCIGTSAAIAAITLSSGDQLFQKTIIKPVIRAVIQQPNLIHARSHHQFISFIITS